MKRWLFLIATVLLLCGCAAEPEETTPDTPEETAAHAITEPAGYYDPDSALEASTDGSLRVYPLNRTDSYGLYSMEEDLLLLSGNEVTTLTRLTGNNLYVSAAANLDCHIPADSPAFHAGSKGVTYFDNIHRALVYLDTQLKEVSRISLPEASVGAPALSADRKVLYYCTDSAIRAIDLETNLDKLIREFSFASHSIVKLHCGDTVLQCAAEDSYGNLHALFISVKTGETLYEYADSITLQTAGEHYLCTLQEGAYRKLLIGTGEAEPLMLVGAEYDAGLEPILENEAAVLISNGADTTSLSYYDLSTGLRSYALELPGTKRPAKILGGSAGSCVWILRWSSEYESDILCRWELAKTPTGENTNYLSTHYTAENPDSDGLAALNQRADAIGQAHGVEILLWNDAVSALPREYDAEPEYQVPLLNRWLDILDEALSAYPKDFLLQAASATGSGKIRIGLVRSVSDLSGETEDISGLEFWDQNQDAFIIAAIGADTVTTLYNKLFHIIDSRVISTCSLYDSWNDLNPKKFSYSFSYRIDPQLDASLFEGEKRAFIDPFSTTFPREDRARIMEYAMQEDNEDLFKSKTMQKKLRQLCRGIREGFKLEDSAEVFIWEQYLEKPLAKS